MPVACLTLFRGTLAAGREGWWLRDAARSLRVEEAGWPSLCHRRPRCCLPEGRQPTGRATGWRGRPEGRPLPGAAHPASPAACGSGVFPDTLVLRLSHGRGRLVTVFPFGQGGGLAGVGIGSQETARAPDVLAGLC